MVVIAAGQTHAKEAQPDEDLGRKKRQSVEDARKAYQAFLSGMLLATTSIYIALTRFFLGRPRAEDFSAITCRRSYIQLGDMVHNNVTTKATFEAFFQMLIGLMCVLMGIETYLPEEGHPTVDGLMLLLVVFFTLWRSCSRSSLSQSSHGDISWDRMAAGIPST
jgi:hypothetical protein